ncbi:RFT1 [Trinorchestia longiramus]|nr:RFT1 [Trinorchestia longiramus]
MTPKNWKSGALQSAAYDTILQVCLRVVSFVLNAVVVRNIGPATLAVCSVRLLLLYSTALLLTREAFRRAALSAKEHQLNYQLVNLIWAGAASLVPVSCLLSYVWCNVMSPPPLDVLSLPHHYTWGVVLMLLCCALELLAEVPFVLAELQLWTKTRVVIEGAMQLMRSAGIVCVVMLAPDYTVLGYCTAHLLGSCIYCASYYVVFWRAFADKTSAKVLPFQSMRQLLPSRQHGERYPRVEKATLKVARGFLLQCWLKELLTEGEWFLMNFLPLVSLTQQGTYQVVSNLGALGARLVFRSIETAAYKFFAQTLYRDTPLHLQDKERVKETAEFLESLLRHLWILGLVLLCFGYSYSNTLLQVYGGEALSSSGTGLMRAQCLLLVFLALNGVTEAYTFAALDHTQLHWHSSLLVVFSVTYLAVAAVLTQLLGVVGFVWANCLNMSLRIAHGWWFIERQYRPSRHRPLAGLLLPRSAYTACITAWVVTALSEVYVSNINVILHLGVGAVMLLFVLVVLREELRSVYTPALLTLDRLFTRLGLQAPPSPDGDKRQKESLLERADEHKDIHRPSVDPIRFNSPYVSVIYQILYGIDKKDIKGS